MTINTQYLKQQNDCRLIAAKYTELRKVNSHESHGPCPFCGGHAQKQWEQKLRISGLTQRQIWFLGQMCYCRHQLWATLNIDEANAITPH